MQTSEMLARDDLKSIEELNSLLAKKRSRQTFKNWMLHGKRGYKLPGVFDGNQWLFSLAAFLEFVRLTSEPPVSKNSAAQSDADS